MKFKIGKTMRLFARKTFNILLSILMMFSCVNLTGIQSVYAALSDTNIQTKAWFSNPKEGIKVWGTAHAYEAHLGTTSNTDTSTRSFCLDLGKTMKSGTIMSKISDKSKISDSEIRKVLTWYFTKSNKTSAEGWVAQTLIWGLRDGYISTITDDLTTTADSYQRPDPDYGGSSGVQITVNFERFGTGDTGKNIRNIWTAFSVPFNQTPAHVTYELNGTTVDTGKLLEEHGGDYEIGTYLQEIENVTPLAASKFDVWDSGNSSYQTWVGYADGNIRVEYVLPITEQVDSTKSYSHSDNVTIQVNKKDSSTKQNLEGVTFDLYRDNVKISTLTTDSNGNASYTWTTTYTKSATSSVKKYCSNWDLLSELVQKEVTDLGYGDYHSRSSAQTAADEEALQKAKDSVNALLNEDHTFKLVEVGTRTGYWINPNDKSWTKTVHSGPNGVSTVTFNQENTNQSGSITITKRDSVTKNTLPGAVFTVYAAEDIYHPDGKTGLVYSKDQAVKDSPATDSNGSTTITGLLLGKYYVKEKVAPTNYVINTSSQNVTLSYAGQDAQITTQSCSFENDRQKGTITISKADDETGRTLENAVYELYAKNDIVHPDGKTGVIYSANTKIATFPATNSGTTSLSNLYLGQYYVKEVTAPTNYVLNSSAKDITLSYAGQEVLVSVQSPTYTNHRQEGKITVTKHDTETDRVVAGAVYRLYANDTIYYPDGHNVVKYNKGDLVGTFPATNSNGSAFLEHLYLGKYIVKEYQAPYGYFLESTEYPVTISYAGQDVSVTTKSQKAVDKVQRGTISFKKVDEELENGKNSTIFDNNQDGAQADATRYNAVYGLYALEDIVRADGSGVVTYDSTDGSIHEIKLTKGTELSVKNVRATAGTLLATAKTDANGDICFEHLYNGKYYIQEITPSEGYVLDTTRYNVDLSYTNQNESIVVKDGIKVYETVKKQAIEIKKNLKDTSGSGITQGENGAHFKIILESDYQHLITQGYTPTEAKTYLLENVCYDEIVTQTVTMTVNGVQRTFDGYAKSIELPYGTYRLVQTVSPGEYAFADDTIVHIKRDSRSPKSFLDDNDPEGDNLLIVDEITQQYIRIQKKDKITNEIVTLDNASFKIVTNQDITWGGKFFKAGDELSYSYANGETINTWVTNNNTGMIQLPEKLSSGTYTAVEVKAPDLYVKDAPNTTFRVTKADIDPNAQGEPVVTVVLKDTPQVGNIKVSKKGEVLTGVIQDELGNYNFTYSERFIAGAKVQLVAKEDILNPATGTVIFTAGTVIETKTTGNDGLITFTGDTNATMSKYGGLLLGEYYIKEIEAPKGFTLNSDVQNISLTYEGEDKELVLRSNTITNDRQKVQLNVEKTDGTTNEFISGATFMLVTKDDIVDVDGNILLTAGTVIETRTTNNGRIEYQSDLPLGNYQISESEPAPGYATDQTVFDIDATAKAQEIGIIRKTIRVVNRPTQVEIVKIDANTQEEISGATLVVTDKNGNEVDRWASRRNDSHIIKNLLVGETYTLTEITAPTGYIKSSSKQFIVTDTGDLQTVVLENETAKGKITVVKKGNALTDAIINDNDVDFVYSDDQPLEGAVFKVYAKQDIKNPDGISEDLYKKGDLVDTITTGIDGTATTKALPLGDYTVVEDIPPVGYLSNDELKHIRLSYENDDTPLIFEQTTFINERQTLELDAVKKDADTQNLLEGAEFTIYNKNPITSLDGNLLIPANTPIETVVTDENGHADFTKDFPLGLYIVKETGSPVGYNSTEKTINFDGNYQKDVNFITETFTFENKITKVKISKQDINSSVEIEGNILQLFDANDHLVEEWISELNKSHYIEGLHVGETYTLVEKLASEGYLKAGNIEFVVLDNGDTGDVQEVQIMYDEHAQGQITVEKRGMALVSTSKDAKDNIVFNYDELGLAGAVFEIYATEDIKHPDKVSEDFYKADDLVDTVTTDENGIAISKKLPLGKYTVKEITAPEGYINNSDEKTVSLTYKDQLTPIVYDSATYLNNRQTVDVDAIKRDSETNTLVAGAEFSIFATEDILAHDGTVVVHAGDKIESVITDKNGLARFATELPLSVYVVKETHQPDGYHSTSKKYILDASYQGQDVEEITAHYEFTNIPTDVEISKQDSTNGVETAGNILQIFDSTGYKVEEWTSELNKTHQVKYLTVGETYTLVEKIAANGYLKAEDMEFTVEDYGDLGGIQTLIPMKDEHAKAKIVVEKHGQALVDKTVDENGNTTFVWEDRGLEGAEFKIYAKEHIKHPDGVSSNIYNKGDLVATLTTGEDGTATSDELPIGEYRVIETVAPDGYLENNENVQDVKFVYKDQFTHLQIKTLQFTNERQTVELDVSKKDSETGQMVEGAEFTIYPKTDIIAYDGTVLISANKKIETVITNENGIANFQDSLPLYEYEIKETHQPDGYHSTNLTYDFDATYQGPTVETISGSFEFVNIPTQVKLSKQDITTQVETAGNYLQVFDKETGELIDEWVSKLDESHYIKYLTTGKTYVLVEKLAAYGYLKADDIEFVVEDYADNGGVQEIQPMNDELVKGQISVTKKGEVLTGIHTDKDGNITFNYEEKNLQNAVYEIYAREDIKHPDGKSEDFYKTGELVDTITTGNDGVATSMLLPLGAYEVVEKTAPEGFVLNSESQKADLVYADQVTALVFDNKTFTNERQTVDLDVVKKDSNTGLGVKGAEFTLYAKNDITDYTATKVLVGAGDRIETVVTNEDGYASFTDTLPLYEYTIKETKAPVGYHSTAMTDEIDATYKGQDVSTIENTSEFINIPTKVKISKQDITTQVETAGNYLQVFDCNGQLVDEWVSALNEPHYIEYLHVGETYTLVEKLAAVGYLKADDIQFTIIDDGDNGRVQEIQSMKDELVHGKITVEKKGNVLVGVEDDQNGFISFKYEAQGLSDAVYEIYAREDIVHPDGVTNPFYNKGDLVATLTTGEDGTVTSDELPLGEYEVHEVKAPNGYVLNSESKNVDLIYDDQYTELVYNSANFTNMKQDVEITVKKQDIEKGVLLQGAEFALYTVNDILDVDGQVLVKAGTEIERVITDAKGTAQFNADLPLGNYKVIETKAPIGYASTDTEIEIDANYQGQLITVISTEVGFKNKQIEFDVSKKSITTGEELAGATLAIYPADENGQPKKNECFETWISTNVPHKIYGLEVDRDYVLVETNAPFDNGYVTSENINFKVLDTSNIQKVEMIDDITKLSISKSDMTDGKFVIGAKLSIFKVNDDGTVNDNPLYTWITTDDEHYIEQIPVGKYILREELSNARKLGYVTAEDVEFEVKDTKEIQKINMKDDHTYTEFTKENVNGEKIAGATMAIVPLDNSGNPVYDEMYDSWITQLDNQDTKDVNESIHAIEYMPVGKYMLVEVTAPNGYVKAKPIIFEVKDTSEVQHFDMVDKLVEYALKDATTGSLLSKGEIIVSDEHGNIVDKWTTQDKTHLITGLEEGKKYTITEVIAPDEYVITKNLEFEVTSDKENQYIEMKNKQVKFDKTDVTGEKEITGAQIEVIDKNGNIVDKWISTNLSHYISGLKEGEGYTLTEVVAPEKFVKAESITFTVFEEKVNQTVIMKDKQVTVSHIESVDNTPLEDSKITITDKETGEIIDEWINGKEDHIVSGLEEDKVYILSVTEVPDGYKIPASLEMTITNNKEDQHFVIVADPYTSILVNKVDSITKKAIVSKDFEFTMYSDSECKNAIRTVSANQVDGTATFDRVEFGTYYIKETKAPLGYMLSDEVKKIVVDKHLEGVGKVHSFVYENSLKPVKVDVPETGDNQQIVKYAALAILAGSLLIVACKKLRKKNDN